MINVRLPKLMEGKPADWNISDLYQKSWQIVKNNKVLWLFGMAAVSFTSSGGSRLNLSQNNINSIVNFFHGNGLTPTPASKLSMVLGASTSNPFIDNIRGIFFSVPTSLYLLLGVGLLLLIVVSIALTVIYQSWVNGSLISGVYLASENDKTTITQSSSQSLASLKGLLWLSIIPLLIYLSTFAIMYIILISLISILPSTIKAIPIILTALVSIIFLVGLLFINLTQIWAIRKVVIDKDNARKSFWASLEIVKKKFWRMLGLGIVNSILSVVVMAASLLPVVIVGAVVAFIFISSHPNGSLLPILIGFGVVIVLILIMGYSIFFGAINSFKASVWTLAYKTIKGDLSD